MAHKGGISFIRLQRLSSGIRVLSKQAIPDISQNGGKHADFPGAKAPYVSKMKFLNEQSYDPIPIYRVIDNKGQVIDRTEEPRIDNETLLNMYKTMVQLNQMDEILIESQQQGRISMYLTNYGEEGIQVGSGAALLPRDMIFAQYRELGVLLYRGMTVTEIVNQCYGNHEDRDKGRQIPMHFGNKEKNIVTASSPLATQMPQAVGAAYAFKRAPNNERCVICYFGDGAASEGDAHAAFNFAATLQCPVILFCRNNGYAVWTPTNQQYRGDGIAARGLALGLHTIRVDGTDALAVYRAVERAREIAIQNKPVLIESMSYRVGLHSTADFSNNAFRSVEEIQKWAQEENPVEKLRLYLEGKGLWNSDIEKQFAKEARDIVLRTIQEADQKKKAHWKEMLKDVYYVMPQHLQKQMNQMEKHLEKYKEHYPLDQFQSE